MSIMFWNDNSRFSKSRDKISQLGITVEIWPLGLTKLFTSRKKLKNQKNKYRQARLYLALFPFQFFSCIFRVNY